MNDSGSNGIDERFGMEGSSQKPSFNNSLNNSMQPLVQQPHHDEKKKRKKGYSEHHKVLPSAGRGAGGTIDSENKYVNMDHTETSKSMKTKEKNRKKPVSSANVCTSERGP